MKIKVNREELSGRLDSTIIKELGRLNILKNVDFKEPFSNYDLEFYRKNNRVNGKQFIVITPTDSKEVVKAYWIKDIYRFNTTQSCTLIEVAEKEIDSLLYGVNFW